MVASEARAAEIRLPNITHQKAPNKSEQRTRHQFGRKRRSAGDHAGDGIFAETVTGSRREEAETGGKAIGGRSIPPTGRGDAVLGTLCLRHAGS